VRTAALIALSGLALAGCMSQPVDVEGGKHFIQGYKLETVMERAREHCGPLQMVTTQVSEPIMNIDWARVTFICK
jgi:hypothetical protein